MTKLNWKFVSISAARSSIMFMLCMGNKLICEFSQLQTRKKRGHPVTAGTTLSPFEYATMIEGWIKKSGLKLEGPAMADYVKSVNYGHQIGFENVKKPDVDVVVIDIFEWKRLQKIESDKEKKNDTRLRQ